MARVIIDDRWLRTAEDGAVPSSAAKRSLANTKDLAKARVPEKWRTSIYGTGKRWRVRWYVADSDGKNIQKSRYFEKLSDAESFKAAMEDDIRAGRYRDPNAGHHLFRVVAEEWPQSKVDIKDVTLGRYTRDTRCMSIRSGATYCFRASPSKTCKAGSMISWPGTTRPNFRWTSMA